MSIDQDSKGNMSMVTLVDSSKKEGFKILDDTMWNAFEHFGMPYEVLDLNYSDVAKKILVSHSVVVIGQIKLGSSISKKETQAIADAVKEGVGFVNYDGYIDLYEHPIQEMLGMSVSSQSNGEGERSGLQISSGVRTVNIAHYITGTREHNTILFHKPVEGRYVKITRGGSSVLMSMLGPLNGCPAVIATNYGKGRAVTFALSPQLWLNEFLGHTKGLDDVFWKSIVWATKKPFVMLAMPPFVTMRIDDSSGSHNHFKWLDIVNKHGYIPNVGIFPDNLNDEDAKVLKAKYDAGLAEFSPHALSYNKLIYWDSNIPDHDAGKERTVEELRLFFDKLDKQFEKWGIKQSKVLNAHWGEIGKNAIRFLREREVTAMMDTWVGEPYFGWHLDWKPKPYGNHANYFDQHPHFPDIFCIGSAYVKIPFIHGQTDQYLEWEDDKFKMKGFGSASFVDTIGDVFPQLRTIEEIAKAGSEQIQIGLDNMFFGLVLTHEQRVSLFSLEEWDAILTSIDKMTAKYDKIFKGYDYIAEYARNKTNSKISKADYEVSSKNISCTLNGRTTMPLFLYVFKNNGNLVEHMFQEIPTFIDSTTFSFNTGAFLNLNIKRATE